MTGHILGNDAVIGQPIAREQQGNLINGESAGLQSCASRVKLASAFGNMAQIFGKSSNSIARVIMLAVFFGFFGF